MEESSRYQNMPDRVIGNGSDLVLVMNAGSSSLKFQLFRAVGAREPQAVLRGQMSGLGSNDAMFRIWDAASELMHESPLPQPEVQDHGAAYGILASWLEARMIGAPRAVGHRIVHGGPRMSEPVIVSDQVIRYLETLVPLAPLHQRNNLMPVYEVARHWPAIPQIACFDTAFHRTQDRVVERFAIPQRYFEQGVRRYGFHGLSYQYIAKRLRHILPEVASGRVIAAHLGSGASACAMVNGISRETTMGFTALDGLPMSTRPGRLDPGVVLWMMQQGMTHDEVQDVLYHRSGLKGLSGISGDMRTLLASHEPRADLAIDYFTYRVAESIAGLTVAAAGIDALIFTAGVGENQPAIRAKVCRRLEWLGIKLDDAANARNELTVSSTDSAIGVYVIPTNEEQIIAEQTCTLISGEALKSIRA